MSAIQYLTSGGMASIAGDFSETEQQTANEIVKIFGQKVKKYAINLQVPASILKVQQCTYLFIGKDTSNFYFIFAEQPGNNNIIYRDFSSEGRLELQSLVHQIRIEVGEVVWAFSYPINVSTSESDEYIQPIVQQYVTTVLESQHRPDKKISNEAISAPEIASGLEKFRADHSIEKKTAFIIMQFKSTKPHTSIIKCIKDTLGKYDIIALRADDKEYMDDLFLNIRTYMHACDFGIAVLERITEDDFNPNVSLEIGYMFGLGKNVLLLKDHTLKSLQTDLAGKLYKQFDTNDIEHTLPEQIEKWLKDKGLINI
jgi:hypothetical protein